MVFATPIDFVQHGLGLSWTLSSTTLPPHHYTIIPHIHSQLNNFNLGLIVNTDQYMMMMYLLQIFSTSFLYNLDLIIISSSLKISFPMNGKPYLYRTNISEKTWKKLAKQTGRGIYVHSSRGIYVTYILLLHGE